MGKCTKPLANSPSRERFIVQNIEPPTRIGILYHPRVPEAQRLAQRLQQMVTQHGGMGHISSALVADEECIHLNERDMLITLGGDGTMLQAAQLAAPYGVPILGVKLGHLGFLAELLADEIERKLPDLMRGKYWLEGRMMLHTKLYRADERLAEHEALNDVVINRSARVGLVRVSAYVDADLLATYAADGVIVSSPTGSTGYALAVGGPLLPPELRNLLLIPIAPHLSMHYPIVLPEWATVSLKVIDNRGAHLSADGRYRYDLQRGDLITVCAGDTSYFVRMQPRTYFYRTLQQRLRWRNDF